MGEGDGWRWASTRGSRGAEQASGARVAYRRTVFGILRISLASVSLVKVAQLRLGVLSVVLLVEVVHSEEGLLVVPEGGDTTTLGLPREIRERRGVWNGVAGLVLVGQSDRDGRQGTGCAAGMSGTMAIISFAACLPTRLFSARCVLIFFAACPELLSFFFASRAYFLAICQVQRCVRAGDRN